MARDSSGTQNQPQYSGVGAPADAADMSEVANYAALVGNRKAGASSARTALTGADLWNGLQYYETDTGITYLYTGSAWTVTTPMDARNGTGKSNTPAVRAATVSGTTSAGGDLTVTFPAAFPNSCWAVLLTDSNTGTGIGMVGLKVMSKSTTQFVVRHYTPSSGATLNAFASSLTYVAFGE